MIRPLALDRETLGNDFSVNIAFLRCNPLPEIYTMLEVKKKRRNCQGGWLLEEDIDAFAAASREAYEEIIPLSDTWQKEMGDYLRNLYFSNSKNLSIQIQHKLNIWKGKKSAKAHVSMRVILPSDHPLYEVLTEKDIGCDGINGNEQTSNLMWETLDVIQSSNGFHFGFDFTRNDINTENNEFVETLQFNDFRYKDKLIRCSQRGCNEFIFTALEALEYALKNWQDPKRCKSCKLNNQRK